MAFPQVTTGVNIKTLGSNLPATLAWGTEGLYTGVIVKSVRSSQMVEEVKIENGSGITATDVILIDGSEVEITVVDDRAVTFPGAANTVALIDPIANGNSIANTTTFQVINNNYNAARKEPGERVLLCKKYTLITPA